MTYEAVCNHAEWHIEHRDNYVWYIRGGELDGQYYRGHYPHLVDDYEGCVELWWWEE